VVRISSISRPENCQRARSDPFCDWTTSVGICLSINGSETTSCGLSRSAHRHSQGATLRTQSRLKSGVVARQARDIDELPFTNEDRILMETRAVAPW